MALDLGAIRTQLAEDLRSGLERSNLNVTALLPDRPMILPHVMVVPATNYVDYQQAFSKGLGTVELEIRCYAPMTESGQVLLDEMLSAGTDQPNSVIDALASARLLAGRPWADLVVRTAQFGGRVALGDENTPAYVVALAVTVIVPRS